MTDLNRYSRRHILQMGIGALAACSLPCSAAQAFMPVAKGIKRLSLHNLHTDERLSVVFWKDGKYDRAAYVQLNRFLRDYRTGDMHPMSLSLFDLLHDLQHNLGNDNTLEIISGYRSPRTNAMLARASHGVAKKSLHMEGKAMDIRLPGTSLAHLHNAALAMNRGGVGYYPDSEFVHVDVGPVRRW